MREGARGLVYCRGRLKRAVDLGCALTALVVLAPLLGVLAGLVVASMGRPVFFRQERVGLDGRRFRIWKLRTMRAADVAGLLITGQGDPRITRFGRFLRRTKLDELPQLVNIIRGDMSVVGPRPEVPRYVSTYAPDQRRILKARPGLTDPATVRFMEEEALLGTVDEASRDRYYREHLLPRKLLLNLEYLERAGFWYDVRLIVTTLWTLMRAARP